MKIEIIRHGDTGWMALRKYQGRTDIPLSAAGKEKLKKADYCPDAVYVSALVRAQETAACIFPGARQIVIPDLNEMDFGVFEGRSADEMADDEQYRAWVDSMCLDRCPNGETKEEFSSRVCQAFSALLDTLPDDVLNESAGVPSAYLPADDPPELIIVAHGGTAMAIMERFCDERKPFYEWYLKSGCGFIVETSLWKEKKQLKLQTVSDHNKES